jgi:hypothetical protein
MKIVLHGFGTYPFVFRHLVAAARKTASQLEWAVILPNPHHGALMREVMGDDDILSLQDHLVRDIKPLRDASELSRYPGRIFANIEAEKYAFKHRPAWEQLARAAEIYRIYKKFLQRVAPTHILLPQIEGYEGRMLPHLAGELGIQAMIPMPGRNLGGTFFAPDAEESLPRYRGASPAHVEAARKFVARFRSEGVPATGPANTDPDDEILGSAGRPLPARALEFFRRSVTRPDLFEVEHLRTSILNNLPWFRDTMWRVNRTRGEKEFDIARLEDLPKHFIYYPLQVTPESSINTPAPYFVDQMRAIDAIRFAMPNDHLLLVKEHPSAILTRPPSFVRSLRRRAGVVVAHYRTDSRALIERAALTISVTGTSTLEAFLLGRPALALGPSFIAPYVGGVCGMDELRARIRQVVNQLPPDDAIVKAVAEVLSVSYDFVLRPPGLPGEPGLRRGNIERMLAAILDHAAREKAATRGAAQ